MNEDRQMFSGNWTCAKCGGSIKELPFEPRDTSNLMCRDCHRENKSEKRGGNFGGGERKMFQGNWKCADCGGPITQLPFEPRETGNLKCRDCFKNNH